MVAASVGFQCPECVREGRRSVRTARTIYGGRSTGRAGQVSIVIIALNIGVLLAKLSVGANPVAFSGSGGTSTSLDARFALLPARYDFDHEYYRFVTSMFLHTGLIHLALNCYAIYLLGPALEAMLGRWRFLALYLFAGLGGSALSYVTNQGGEGASGAVFGLFAAFYVFGRHQRRDTSQILGVIVANLIFSMVVPNIGYWAHIGGLVAGGIIALGIAYAPRGSLHLPVQLSGFALVGLLVVALTAVGAQQTLTFGGKSPEPNGVLSTSYHRGTAPEHGGNHA
jgi:membrane associated rhomboid family serine protease